MNLGRIPPRSFCCCPAPAATGKATLAEVIPLLQRDFRVLCVSYDGFDETESTEFPTMLAETEKIEAYILKNCGGHIRAAYGCSLGSSFVGLLAARQTIRMVRTRYSGQLRP